MVNILKGVDARLAVDEKMLQDKAEEALFDAARALDPKLAEAIRGQDYARAFELLLSLRAVTDTFFDDVMVMCDDQELSANRLALLAYVKSLFLRVADLSQIVVGRKVVTSDQWPVASVRLSAACCLLSAMCCLMSTGCRPTQSHAPIHSSQSAVPEPARVPKQKLVVGHDTALVEVANSEPQRQVGLMFRTVMAENEGMLFVFDAEGIYPFWMRNTELPLSIAFIERGGRIADIQDMAPHDETSRHASSVPVSYALEMNQGWFERHDVKTGDSIQVGMAIK